MMPARQKTITTEAELRGIGLHSGAEVRLRVRPAAEDTGVRFVRVDVDEAVEIAARLESVVSTDRGTTIGAGESRVATIEHFMAAVCALEIDNLRVEIDGPEVPIGDGSFRPFYDLLCGAGIREQEANAVEICIPVPLSIEAQGGSSYAVFPGAGLKVSSAIEFAHPAIGRQFGSFSLSPETFATQIAPARTFGFVQEAESLRARGLARGASLENAIILDDRGVASGQLRFSDEFVRHKVGDLIGDLALLGGRLRAHIVADRPSHAGNIEIARLIATAARRNSRTPIVDIERIMQHLPHRYPMLLVDRIVEFEPGRRIVGIKNVTINEPFFQGHYPGHPIMPGVLIIEAMAQVGGLLLMDAVENPEEKVVYFMSLDNVKWRRPVTPGDQIRFELEMLQMRRHVCRMRGEGFVDGHLVVEADMMARIVDR
jgi:UDP-3-O-[3-hydroxymyristoyl] N-acetylglucosamine deacetylase/3-hydroxyacyl-[acyl-carrier-protein] dehydratase